MKILILGASGMAGHVIYRWLREREYDVVAHARSPLLAGATYTEDLLSNHDALGHMVARERPQFIINCTGILVKESRSHPHLAAYINAYLPHYLEHLGPTYDFSTIHISTDCVFSGDNGDYREDSIKDEMAPYGLSKSLGELDNDRDCTIRTSIVGPELKAHGSGLLAWFLRQTGAVQGYTNAWWNGVTTLELAKFIDIVITQKITGLTNLCAAQALSKFELLQIFMKVYQRNMAINPHALKTSIDKTLVMTRDDFTYEQREVSTMLEELRDWYE